MDPVYRDRVRRTLRRCARMLLVAFVFGLVVPTVAIELVLWTQYREVVRTLRATAPGDDELAPYNAIPEPAVCFPEEIP